VLAGKSTGWAILQRAVRFLTAEAEGQRQSNQSLVLDKAEAAQVAR
jgi:hypothetical protein